MSARFDAGGRLSTGVPALDDVLEGGLPTRSVVVIGGEPGSGKTVLALQMVFHLARAGGKILYFTTLSEPPIKLIHFMQRFSFFDQALVDDRVVFADLGAAIRSEGGEKALAQVSARVEQEEPDLVVIDSFKAIHDLLGDPTQSRPFVYDLAVHMASWGATSLLIGEYTASEIATHPEFAIADGILLLTTERQELTSVRQFEILKLRGTGYVMGRHFFEIGGDGVAFYPRVRPPPPDANAPWPGREQVATGVTGLDELLNGGLLPATSTLVQGATGTGKTLLSLRFLVEGARRGEPGILFTLEETPQQLRGAADQFGWDLPALEKKGLLSIEYSSPVELSTDRFLGQARQRIEQLGARRAVLDGLTSMSLGVPSERRFRELSYAFTKHFRAAGVTLLMTMEVIELLGSAQLAGHGVSISADTVVMLRYVEIGGGLERAICVLKARGLKHLTELRRFHIGDEGVEVGPPFEEMRGVLTGVPVPSRDSQGG